MTKKHNQTPTLSHRPRPSRNERVLRERILKFTYQERFAADLDRAMHDYFGPGALRPGGTLTFDKGEIPAFQEWYIHDDVTAEGERIIDLFAGEVGPRLPAAQQEMLGDWRETNRLRLFKVQAVEPGVGLAVQDLLSGEIMEVNDISASHALRKCQVMLAWPLRTEGRLHLTGSMVPLTPMQKPELLQCARELWDDYRAQHPEAALNDFYRDHSLDLLRCQEEVRNAPPLEHVTPKGHPLVRATARYTVRDLEAVRERLDEAAEFLYVGTADEDESADAYVWVLTGRSHVPEVPVTRGMIHRSEWVSESGERMCSSSGWTRRWATWRARRRARQRATRRWSKRWTRCSRATNTWPRSGARRARPISMWPRCGESWAGERVIPPGFTVGAGLRACRTQGRVSEFRFANPPVQLKPARKSTKRART